MGKALYRKYRSKSLDEIIGQPHITTTLRNAIANDNISHAYLFTGPRGVGKTSIARILAHEINHIDYQDDSNHLDIIEIDAASNRRIDEIRELRDRVHIAPTSAKYKVYIIDEVHMLTKEAFNALLKTLEEPPAHVVFILATTEAHKLPDTIVSRTQRFTFKPVEKPDVTAHLAHIASEEGFSIDQAGLELIAQHGGGSFRDSISLLDQIRSQGDEIDLAIVQSALGIAPTELLDEIITELQAADSANIIQLLQRIREQGFQASQIARQLSERLRSQLLSGESTISSSELLSLLQKLLDVPSSYDPMAQLELALIGCVLKRHPNVVETPIQPVTVQTKPIARVATKAVEPPTIQEVITPVAKAKTELAASVAPAVPTPQSTPQIKKQVIPAEFEISAWMTALDSLKKTHNTLYSVARMAEPTISGNELTLSFKFAFHQKRLSEVKNQQVVTDILHKITSKPIVIQCIVSDGLPAAVDVPTHSNVPASTKTGADDSIANISNIFGSAEVLES